MPAAFHFERPRPSSTARAVLECHWAVRCQAAHERSQASIEASPAAIDDDARGEEPRARAAGAVDLPALHERTTHVDGLRVSSRSNVDEAPAGAVPIVFLHGLGVSSAYMAPLARRLARHHPVHALDAPGFGRSEAPGRGVPTIAQHADYVRAWLDASRIPRAHLVANSMGCQVAAEVAARHPHRVARLVLIGPTLGGARSFVRTAWQLAVDVPRERRSLIPLHAMDDLRAGPVRILRTLRHATRHHLQNVLPKVDAPTLVLRGTRDPVVSRQEALTAALLARRGNLQEIEGAPHAANFSEPDKVAEAILPFLREPHAGQSAHDERAAARG